MANELTSVSHILRNPSFLIDFCGSADITKALRKGLPLSYILALAFFVFLRQSHCVAQAGFELMTLHPDASDSRVLGL